MSSCLFLVAFWSPSGRDCVWYVLVFSCVFVDFPRGVSSRMWCLVVLIPDSCLLHYFE